MVTVEKLLFMYRWILLGTEVMQRNKMEVDGIVAPMVLIFFFR